MLMWDKAKDFIQKAFTIIFTAAIVIWFLQTFDTRINVVTDSSQSILAAHRKIYCSCVYSLSAFSDWKAATALITGFSAKETVVSTLAVLTGGTGVNAALNNMFTPIAAFSFLTFALLYTPCIAAISAVKREMNSALAAFGVVVFQILTAWVAAFIVYNIGNFIINIL